MKHHSLSDELSGGEARNMSIGERTTRFLAWKAKWQAVDTAVSIDETHWHPVDEEIPLNGFDDLPPAPPGDTQTPLLWVRFQHRRRNEIVVSRGRYDYDGGFWTARLSSVEDGDVICRVVALAWAPIMRGERPWDGPTIRTRETDPW